MSWVAASAMTMAETEGTWSETATEALACASVASGLLRRAQRMRWLRACTDGFERARFRRAQALGLLHLPGTPKSGPEPLYPFAGWP